MADAWSYLPGTIGDAWERMWGSLTLGDAWERLPRQDGDSWENLIGTPLTDRGELIPGSSALALTIILNSRL